MIKNHNAFIYSVPFLAFFGCSSEYKLKHPTFQSNKEITNVEQKILVQDEKIKPMTPPAADVGGFTTKLGTYLDGLEPLETKVKEDIKPVHICNGVETPVEQSCPQIEQKIIDGESYQCSFQDSRQTITQTELSVMSSNADSLWPGALIQGNSVVDGALDPVPINSRQAGTIALTLATGGSGKFSKELINPGLSSTTEAINEILSSNLKGPTPARLSYKVEQIHDLNQMKLALSANYKGIQWGGSGSLNFDASDEKNRILVSFTQEYYTMAFQAPQGAQAVFGTDVEVSTIEPYTGPNNPLLYVSSVSYGRRFYFLFESTASIKDFKSAISASYGNPITSASASLSPEYKAIINKSNIKAFGIGGNAIDAIKAVTGASLNGSSDGKTQMDVIHEFLVKSAEFNAETPGVPIAFTLRYLNNAKIVKVSFTTDFKAKNCNAQSLVATFFKDSNYRGYPMVLPVGRYDLHQLKQLGMANDSISSLKLPPELKVVIWEHAHFSGKHYEISADNKNLGFGSVGKNDFVSSIEVKPR